MKTKRPKRKLKTQPGGSLKPVGSEWCYPSAGEYPEIGEIVLSQDGMRVTPVFWGGVNWWLREGWETHMVTAWKRIPNYYSLGKFSQ